MNTTKSTRATLIIGLGNPILGDDGVGWRVAETVAERLQADGLDGPAVEVDTLSLGGLSLMERLVGYRQAIIVDAIQTRGGVLGQVHTFPLEALPDPSAGHTTAAHDASLQTALAVGREMGAELPQQVLIVAVETRPTFDFSQELSPAVEAAVPYAAQTVLGLLNQEEIP